MRATVVALVGDGLERPEGGRDASLGHPVDELLGPSPVRDQVGDRDHQQIVLLGETLELREPRHRPVVVHDLAQHSGRVQTGHPSEVDRGLGVTGPSQHATRDVAQREDVAGPGEVVRLRVGIDQRLDRRRPDRLPRCPSSSPAAHRR